MGDSDMPVPVTPEAANGKSPVLGLLKSIGAFTWLRPLLHNLGGRKFVLGGGALVILRELYAGGAVTWASAVAGVAVALTTIGIAWAIAHEDKAEKENKK